MTDETLLIFHLRSARLKAREAAVCAAQNLLCDLSPERLPGGPLGDQKGVFWLTIPAQYLETAMMRLPRLGYVDAVDTLEPIPNKTREAIKWRGGYYQINRLYAEDPEIARQLAPDRRDFALTTPSGDVRIVTGYRGDGGQFSKRGLPFYDARLLVNLTFTPEPDAYLLDPFAGIGGIVIEAIANGYHVLSGDIDLVLRYGLTRFGALHSVCDAAYLPYPDNSIHAIATEPPYDPEALPIVTAALSEMSRVLKPDGKIALLCADAQAQALRQTAQDLPLASFLDESIDRKGLGCVVLAWHKNSS